LVCGVKKGSRGIDVHASGPLPACRLPADHFEFTRVRLDFEHCDAVVTAVRIVEEPPAGVDADLRGGVGAGNRGLKLPRVPGALGRCYLRRRCRFAAGGSSLDPCPAPATVL
jgi:hypothetical protein